LKKTKVHYRPRIAQIELLRAVAMGGIFAFHLWSVDPQVNHSGLAGRIMGTAASYGYLGVMIFNFITGFVLALPHLGPQHKQSLPYRHFLRRRFFRICPKYYIALSVWTLVLLFSARQNAKNLLLSYLAHLTFLHSIFPSTLFSIVPAFWWLGLLAQFYLVFPLILAGFIRIGPARACFLTCLACWGSWIILDHFSHPGNSWALINYMIYYNLPARLPEFAMGMWLAAAWRRETDSETEGVSRSKLTPAYLAFFSLALLFALSGSTFLSLKELPLRHIHLVSWCLAGTVALLLPELSTKAGQIPVVVKIAVASYSIYLLHQPLLGYADRLVGASLHPMTEFFLLSFVIGSISFALALALDKLVA